MPKDTIDSINKAIYSRFAQVEAILPQCRIPNIEQIYTNLYDSYLSAIAHILIGYYNSNDNELELTRSYYSVINSVNYVQKVNNLADLVYSNTPATAYTYKPTHLHFDMTLDTADYQVCTYCGTRMDVQAELSELHCEACGNVDDIIGVVFKDDQFYPQDSKISKHGHHESNRHYRLWINDIQGKDNSEVTDAHIELISAAIKSSRINVRTLDIRKIRDILTTKSLTKLNRHASLIIVKCGGEKPPQLTCEDDEQLSKLFNIIISTYNEIIKDRGNKPYYPYFIYKLIEFQFGTDPEKSRLLKYIHMQNRSTIIKNDKNFEKICTKIANPRIIRYKPTQRVIIPTIWSSA